MKRIFKNSIVFSFIPLIGIASFVACSNNGVDQSEQPVLTPIVTSEEFSLSDFSIKNRRNPDKIYVLESKTNQKIDISSSVKAIGFDKFGINGEEIGALRNYTEQEFEKQYPIYSHKKAIIANDKISWYLQNAETTAILKAWNAQALKDYNEAKGNSSNYPEYAGNATFVILSKLDDRLKKIAKENNLTIKTIVNRLTQKNDYLLEIKNKIWQLTYTPNSNTATQNVDSILLTNPQPSTIKLYDKTNSTTEPIDISAHWHGILFENSNETVVSILKISGQDYPRSIQNLRNSDYSEGKETNDLILEPVDDFNLKNWKKQIASGSRLSYAILLKASAPLLPGVELQEITINKTKYKVYLLDNAKYKTEFTILK